MHPKTKQQISNSKTTEGGGYHPPPPGWVWYTGCKNLKKWTIRNVCVSKCEQLDPLQLCKVSKFYLQNKWKKIGKTLGGVVTTPPP